MKNDIKLLFYAKCWVEMKCFLADVAATSLEVQGHIVLNPAELPEGMRPADYMRICFAMIDTADAIYLLENWEYSRGASVEKDYAIYTGKSVITERRTEI